MKKNKSIILGIVIIVTVVLITGCGLFYNLVDSKEFKEYFSALGYSISDSLEGTYESKTYLVAEKSDVPYKIEYYEFEDELSAKKVFEKYKDNITDYLTSSSENQNVTGAVFSKFVAVSTNEYIVISRVKNTLIFIAGTNTYKSEIDTLLEDIKY